MLRATKLFLFIFSLCVSGSVFAQDTQPTSSGGTVLILGAASFDQSFQIEVKTESGEVFACKEVVSARNTCRLEGLPPGKVKVLGKIGGKQMKELALNLPAVGAEIGIEREGLGTVITLGVLTAIGVAGVVDEIIVNNVAGIIGAAILTAGASVFLVSSIVKGRDTLVANGKSVKKDGTIRADLSPLLLQPEPGAKKTTPGLGISIRF